MGYAKSFKLPTVSRLITLNEFALPAVMNTVFGTVCADPLTVLVLVPTI